MPGWLAWPVHSSVGAGSPSLPLLDAAMHATCPQQACCRTSPPRLLLTQLTQSMRSSNPHPPHPPGRAQPAVPGRPPAQRGAAVCVEVLPLHLHRRLRAHGGALCMGWTGMLCTPRCRFFLLWALLLGDADALAPPPHQAAWRPWLAFDPSTPLCLTGRVRVEGPDPRPARRRQRRGGRATELRPAAELCALHFQPFCLFWLLPSAVRPLYLMSIS